MDALTETGPRTAAPAHPAARLAALRRLVPLALWAALIVAASVWGNELLADGRRILLGAPPLFGQWDLHAGVGLAGAVAVGGAIALGAPAATRRLGWLSLLAAVYVAALVWPLALAFSGGVAGITAPLEGPSDYLASLPLIDSAGGFLASFDERVGEYSTHVRSHPPGMVLLLFGLERIGLGGAGVGAALILALAASTALAALVALRSLAGEAAARRAAPFLVLTPAAVWIATTADALFMAVGAWAVALVVLALRERGRRSPILALAGGVLFGCAAFLSFGLVLLWLIPAAVAAYQRRLGPLLIALAGAAAVALPFLAAGYWWLEGYEVARGQYRASIAMSRPYDFFLLSNLAAFALATGPAVAIGLARLRDRRAWLLVGGGLAAVGAAALSGMSKGEVERIWLPFVPWVALTALALPQRPGIQRALLGGQLALALAIEVSVATIW